MPLRLGLLLLLLLGGLIASGAEIRSDAGAIFGSGSGTGTGGPDSLASLDSLAGRSFVVGLVADPEKAARAARALEAGLRGDPLVDRLDTGPVAPSGALIGFLWTHRFALAPPDADAVTAGAFETRLRAAREAFAHAEGALLADYLFRDPTGAFADAVDRLRGGAAPLPTEAGLWRARDGTGTMAFGVMADAPFDVAGTAALVGRIHRLAEEAGARAHVVGPRIVSAQVSASTSRLSTRAVLWASALLVLALWLSLRSLPGVLTALLPPVLGAAAATLCVQAAFGHVHVVALGFGGALTGLALDYPLHLASRRDGRAAARRVVFLGAATTGVAFLALLGADIPVLRQTGVFVATGLLVAALAATRLPGPARVPLAPDLRLRAPRRAAAAICALALAVLLVAPQSPPEQMIEPPRAVVDTIGRIGAMADLPSARFEIRTEAATLPALMAARARLRAVLEEAVREGAIAGHDPVGLFDPGSPPPTPPLAVFARGLDRAGLDPAFAARQREDYATALAAPAMTPEDMAAIPELAAMAAGIERTETGLRSTIRLRGTASGIAERLGTLPEGSTLVDLARIARDGLDRLRGQAMFWLAVGAGAAALTLFLALRETASALRAALIAAAGASGAAAAMTVIGGGLGVFQIVSLTLLVGIGLDYGLILSHADTPERRADARRSIALCAGSSLIAFLTMALSGAPILREIGMTVAIGVTIAAGLSLAESSRSDG